MGRRDGEHMSAKRARESKNLLQSITIGARLDGANGGEISASSYKISPFIPVNSEKISITCIAPVSTTWQGVCCLYDDNRAYISGRTDYPVDTWSITVNTNGAAYIRISTVSIAENIMLNEGSTALPYEPYGATIWEDCAVKRHHKSKNIAWTGWAEDAETRGIGVIRTVDTRSSLEFSAAAGYPNYDDNNWIFSTTWAENTQYAISFDYSRPSSQSARMIMQVRYTDGSSQSFGECINDGGWHYFAFTTAANKTVKNICAHYTSGTLSIDINTFMVNEGTTPEPYEPYGLEVWHDIEEYVRYNGAWDEPQ